MTISAIPRIEPRVGVVERVTQILDAFAEAPGHLLLEEITQITGLPRSTAFRILGQLIDQGWISHGPRGYAIGSRLPTFSARSQHQEEIRAKASEHLNTLHLRTNAVAHLSVLEGGFIRYLDKVGGRMGSTVPSRVGARLLATDTVSGRALLAALPAEIVDKIMADARSREYSFEEQQLLHQGLTQIRSRQGVAVQHAKGERGITSVGVALHHRGQPVAALSIAWRGMLNFPALLHELLRTASAIHEELMTA